MLNPILKKRIGIYIYILLWVLIAGIHFSFLFFSYNQSLVLSLVESFVFNGIYGFIGIVLWFVVRYNDIESLGMSTVALNHFGAIVVVNSIWLYGSFFIIKTLYPGNSEYLDFLSNSLPWRGIVGVFFYIVLGLSYYSQIYYSNLQERIIREQKLKTNIKEAELSFLRSQINPHFLFNSLNSISSLTTIDAEKAQEMIIRLSGFLRYSLGKNEKQLVSLYEEIENCKAYLQIEKVRFGDKLNFEFIMPGDPKEFQLPNLILQPLLENAIKHGVYESTEIVNISIEAMFKNDALKIIIDNNFDPDSVPRKGKGIGLKNISERLKLIYENKNLFSYQKTDNNFIVTLLIPQNIDK